MISDSAKAALLRTYGWTETQYKTWQGPGWPWFSAPWHLDRAYARVTGNSTLETMRSWPRTCVIPPCYRAPEIRAKRNAAAVQGHLMMPVCIVMLVLISYVCKWMMWK